MKFPSFVVGLFLLLGLCGAELIRTNPKTQRLEDDYGRERVFHGTNVVYKHRPYFPITDHFDFQYSFSEEDMKNLQSWGLNTIRLGCLWAGAEPVRGQYNQTYFDTISWIVNKSSEYGIFVLLDQHQDVYNEKFCGEGVPDWAAEPTGLLNFPEPVDYAYNYDPVTGYPTDTDCAKHQWAAYYPTDAASNAFQNLYSNYDSLQDSFALYWQKVAATFKSADNVLGYELINEPWAGDLYENPFLMVPGVADLENLQPMYHNLNKAIRQADPDHLIFFEPVTWDDFYCGFTEVPGGADFRNRSVLSYHYYVPPDIDVEIAFAARMRDIKRLEIAGFMTEYGDVSDDDLQAHADRHFQSWMNWEFKAFIPITGWTYGFYNSDGTLNVPFVKMISRTYATAIQGHGQDMSFNRTTGVFELNYLQNPQIKAPTEIYLNEGFYYPNGYTVTLNPANVATWKSPQTNQIQVIANPSSTTSELTVTITPK